MKLKLILLSLLLCSAAYAGSPVSGGPVVDAAISTSDVTDNDVSSGKHGFAPKSPADASKFLNGAATPDYVSLPVGHVVEVHAAGTSYVLTTTPTALDFGTTDPVATIDQAGTYLIFARVMVRGNGITVDHDLNFKLRRTNNTAADVANSSTLFRNDNPAGGYGASTTTEKGSFVITFPPVTYTTALTTDTVTIFGDVTDDSSAPAVPRVYEASILAVRIF